MAKTQKFSEDLLLEAVIKYSEVVKTKIKATNLADWSRENIPGLEDVRDYHFTRPIKEKNQKTGKITEHSKLCTKKINEINKARSINMTVNNNILLRSSNIDAFFELPISVQRKLVVETRETVDKLLSKNAYLSTENEAFRKNNKLLSETTELYLSKLKEIEKKQNMLEKQINYLLRITDEQKRKCLLKEIGIEDGALDLVQYRNTIEQDLSEVFDIEKALKQYRQESNKKQENEASLKKQVFEGLNFDK